MELYSSTVYKISVMQAVMTPLAITGRRGATSVVSADTLTIENERINCWSILKNNDYDIVGRLYTREQIMICSIVMSCILILIAMFKFKVKI